ncbi:MAG: tetratricopeptide repeat protein, partial [Candidatus Omnitrophota bacterium]
MKKSLILGMALFGLVSLAVAPCASAYWIWSPDLGKWINPKGASKDTPEDQLASGMDFYNQKNYDKAIEEFDKLPAVFPTSRLAAEGVYYAGLCWEEKKDLAKAADSYQKLINQYPYSDRIKDAVKREFEIANAFAEGIKVKVLGVPALP